MADSEFSLKQRNRLGIDVHFNLMNGRELQVVSEGKKLKQSYSVDIISLQDKSKKTLIIAWKWLAIGISFFAVMMLLLKLLPPYLDINKNIYLGSVIFVGILGCLTSLRQFLKKTSIKVVFSSRNALVPIITLSVNKPNKKSFSSFINTVELHIDKNQKNTT